MGRDQGARGDRDRDPAEPRSLRRHRLLGRHGSRRGCGEQVACDNVEKGVFAEEIAYHVMDQGRDLNDMIATVLEDGESAGKLKAVIYSPQLVISKDTLRPG